MRLKFGLTRRPALMALVAGGGMVYVAIHGFGVEPNAVLKVGLLSLLMVLLIAVPAALVVVIWKLVQKWMNKDEGT